MTMRRVLPILILFIAMPPFARNTVIRIICGVEERFGEVAHLTKNAWRRSDLAPAAQNSCSAQPRTAKAKPWLFGVLKSKIKQNSHPLRVAVLLVEINDHRRNPDGVPSAERRASPSHDRRAVISLLVFSAFSARVVLVFLTNKKTRSPVLGLLVFIGGDDQTPPKPRWGPFGGASGFALARTTRGCFSPCFFDLFGARSSRLSPPDELSN